MITKKRMQRFSAAAALASAFTLGGAAQAADQAEVADAAPDELAVDLSDQISDEEVAQLERRYGARFVPVSNHVRQDRIYRVRVAAARGALVQLLDRLRSDSKVEAADLQLLYQLPENARTALTRDEDEGLPLSAQDGGGAFPNDPKYRYQWHLDQLHMPLAWQRAAGQGVTVAVVDTGVTRVEDLQGTELVPGYNFVDNNDNARDDHGHGTHVAGTVAQTTHNGIGVAGVAYKARIMPIKVLSAQGSGTVAGIADGIRWAVDHGAQVINMSLGGRFNSQVLAKAVKYAYDHGTVVVCAAGNDGRNKVSFPAANPGAIAVAATQFDESTTFYSNWGKEIAVAAPGGNTRLDQNGDGVPDGVLQNTVTPGNIEKEDYLLFMGTSMASPHVAGVAALLVGAGVKDPARVEKILRETARKPVHYRGAYDERYGAGVVDAAAALRAAQGEQTGGGLPLGQLAIPTVLFGLSLALLRRRLYRSPSL